jgi:hypothetical protein
MAKLRRDTTSSNSSASPLLGSGSPVIPGASNIPEFNRSLRIVSSGTLFLTHTLYVPVHPAPSTAIRAHAVEKSRGGSANTVRPVDLLFTLRLMMPLLDVGRSFPFWHSSLRWKPC